MKASHLPTHPRKADFVMSHWHVAHGLAGYGPDGSDGFITATEFSELDQLISDELTRDSDAAHELSTIVAETAKALRESGDQGSELESWREAWRELERSNELSTLALNFSPERANAPLYKDQPKLWAKSVRALIDEHFPLDVSEHSKLYVWECSEAECDHLNEE